MMNKITRRDVLKSASTVSAACGLAATASADISRVRVVEVGLRFKIPTNEHYDVVLPDSRPSFTVDEKKGRLLILNTASESSRSQIETATDIVNERILTSAGDVTIGPKDGTVRTLSTELSARMRAKKAVQLISGVNIPNITVHTGGNSPLLTVESQKRVELPVGESTQVRLNPVTAEARTTRVVGKASVDGVPDYMEGLVREEGSVEVEATPVIEAINHGELDVSQQSDHPSS